MRRVLVLTLFATLALTACQTSTASTNPVGRKVQVGSGSYTNISVDDLQSMLANKDFTFVNVHIPYEGDIPGTDLFVPFDLIESYVDQLPADKDAKIVLYCRSGRMSQIAAETLIGLGYTNVWNVEGGMVAWEQAGYALEFR